MKTSPNAPRYAYAAEHVTPDADLPAARITTARDFEAAVDRALVMLAGRYLALYRPYSVNVSSEMLDGVTLHVVHVVGVLADRQP